MWPLLRAFLRPGGGSFRERLAGLRMIFATARAAARDPRESPEYDPVKRLRATLESDPARLNKLDQQIEIEMSAFVTAALDGAA